ncbi:hypothetical protein ISCGN_014800 [Ixodes scapularis]
MRAALRARFILPDFVHIIGGKEVGIPRGHPALTPDAVPTLLPSVPQDLSDDLSGGREERNRKASSPEPIVAKRSGLVWETDPLSPVVNSEAPAVIPQGIDRDALGSLNVPIPYWAVHIKFSNFDGVAYLETALEPKSNKSSIERAVFICFDNLPDVVVSKIEGPVATIAVVGKFHSGKSFLMNQLMGKTKGFGIGPTVRPETMGIWMWGQVGEFRPISLLCSDYKILAKILARRLDTGLKSIIGPHQTYSLCGRKISRKLHIMRAIGEATAEGHQSLAVLQLDLQQAFDRVSHRFLLAALDRFGVGEELRGWIALCYRDISTRLLINSLRLGDKDVRVLAFADDDPSICSSKVQVQTILQHVDRFCAASGAMINKSAGAWLGAWETMPRTFGGIGWSTSLDGYLGVPLDPQRSTAAVWRPTANSVAAKLSPWRCRNLSFFSRAHVCNTVSYPAVLYKAQAVCCPGSQAGKVHRSWAMFVWKTAMEST